MKNKKDFKDLRNSYTILNEIYMQNSVQIKSCTAQ